MSSFVQSAQLFLLARMAFLLIGSVITALLVNIVAGRLSHWKPRARHRALPFLVALPVLTASVLLFSAILPSLVALVVPAVDHCSAHDDAHAHLCFIHLPKPEVGLNVAVLLGLAFVASYVALRAAFASAELLRARRVLSTSSGAPVSGAARGPNEIGRENVQRKLVVSCNVAGCDVVSVVRDIQASVGSSVRLPAGYRIVYGGQFESAEEAARTLGLLSIACLLGMLGLLYSAFGSLRDAVLVMANLPLALIGGAVGVF